MKVAAPLRVKPTSEEKAARRRARHKERWDSDPAYRDRILARNKRQAERARATVAGVERTREIGRKSARKRYWEKRDAETPREREARREKRRERYADDPEYRARLQACAKAARATGKGRACSKLASARYREKVRELRAADPAYDAALRERARAYRTPAASRACTKRWRSKPGNQAKLRRARRAWWAHKMATDPPFKERVQARQRAWYEKNRETFNAKRREKFCKNRHYRVAHNLRCRLRAALQRFRAGKEASAVVDVGCTLEELVAHIEAQLTPEMGGWENYGNQDGNWSLDHVVPFAAFNLDDPAEQRKACHYTNLRPLLHVENLKKGSTRTEL